MLCNFRRKENVKSNVKKILFSLKFRTFRKITYRIWCMSLWYDGANCNERERMGGVAELSKKFFSLFRKIKKNEKLIMEYFRQTSTNEK